MYLYGYENNDYSSMYSLSIVSSQITQELISTDIIVSLIHKDLYLIRLSLHC